MRQGFVRFLGLAPPRMTQRAKSSADGRWWPAGSSGGSFTGAKPWSCPTGTVQDESTVPGGALVRRTRRRRSLVTLGLGIIFSGGVAEGQKDPTTAVSEKDSRVEAVNKFLAAVQGFPQSAIDFSYQYHQGVEKISRSKPSALAEKAIRDYRRAEQHRVDQACADLKRPIDRNRIHWQLRGFLPLPTQRQHEGLWRDVERCSWEITEIGQKKLFSTGRRPVYSTPVYVNVTYPRDVAPRHPLVPSRHYVGDKRRLKDAILEVGLHEETGHILSFAEVKGGTVFWDDKIAIAEVQVYEVGAAVHGMSFDKTRPKTVQELLRAGHGFGSKYYRGPAQDPWGNDFQITAKDVLSYGADGKPGGEGEAADISLRALLEFPSDFFDFITHVK